MYPKTIIGKIFGSLCLVCAIHAGSEACAAKYDNGDYVLLLNQERAAKYDNGDYTDLELENNEVIKLVCNRDLKALKFVPEYAMRAGPEVRAAAYALGDFDLLKLEDNEVAEFICSRYPHTLKFVAEHYKHLAKIVLAAVQVDGEAIQYAQGYDYWLFDHVLRAAVNNNPRALAHIIHRLPENGVGMGLLAVFQDPSTMEHVSRYWPGNPLFETAATMGEAYIRQNTPEFEPSQQSTRNSNQASRIPGVRTKPGIFRC